MPRERPSRPGFERFETVIIRVVAHEIYREFAAHDQLLQKRLLRGLGGRGFLYRLCNRKRTDVSEVQVRREIARAHEFGVIPVLRIILQSASHKFSQDVQGLLRTSPPVPRRRNRSIQRPACDEIFVQRK